MDLTVWLAFVAASAAILAIPGPTILLVASYAIGLGWRVAAPMAAGVALGDFVAMTVSLLGLGALLTGSAALFTAVKTVGALYMMWLGLKLIRSGASVEAGGRRDAAGPQRMFGHAFVVTALNPKSILFFVAFVPQFLDPAAPFAPQAAILIATFVSLAFVNALVVAWLAARAGGLAAGAHGSRIVSTLGGGALIGAGLLALFARRAAS
jgi:threonine/homoserine/homoserine lactone efflux protein